MGKHKKKAETSGIPISNLPGNNGPTAVAGIGASAGGLDALKDFFKAMPPDSGIAFVVIQHLEPTHRSQMADILAKYTAMTVVQATDGIPVQSDCVYTIPPNKYLSIEKGLLRLCEPQERHGMRMAIDFFFNSLAEDQKEKAVCIILSGSGSDGTKGLRAIRSAGGICIAQDPAAAQFAIMPQSAIDTGLVDYVLPAGEMPQTLLAYVRHFSAGSENNGDTADLDKSDDIEPILKLLQARTNSDYRSYKRGTIARRIDRRMGLRQIADMKEYLNLLRKNPQELVQLAKDMLIGVSSFFRDPEAFIELHKTALTLLVAGKSADSPLRVWVPGCATGEEAYSLAILLLEELALAGKNNPVQVFASDVDEDALDTARTGIYPESISVDVSPERLDRFFSHRDGRYQVSKQLRDTIVFARQNLINDPPFSKMDLITCRNVLIYLQLEAQEKIISVFSFALSVGGYLFLGKSENLSDPRNLFEVISKPQRIYRLLRANRYAADLPVFSGMLRSADVARGRDPSQPTAAELTVLNQQALLRHFDAAIILIDPKGRILHFYGPTEKYLGHPKGAASLNVFDLASLSLTTKLRKAIEQALSTNEPVAIRSVSIHRGSAFINATITPVHGYTDERILAIILEDASGPAAAEQTLQPADTDEYTVAQLEAEIRSLRSELEETNHEHESTSEELRVANEEMMSMNEELQSANEELETSKEELQSINEELSTVNNQANEKVGELTDVNNDMSNLFSATEIATVFLDEELRIKRFTPRATELLNLISSDVGRPIAHITLNFDDKPLSEDITAVMKNLAPAEKEVQTQDDRWYTMRIFPYRTLDNRIEGTVLTFTDVTRLKRLEGSLQSAKTYAENIVETIREPLLVLDQNLRVMSANRAFYDTFHVTPKATIGELLYELGDRQWNVEPLRKLLTDIVQTKSQFKDLQIEQEFPGIGFNIMRLNARMIESTDKHTPLILLAIEDVTVREQARQQIESLAAELEQAVEERTSELMKRNEQLRTLALELTNAENRERKRLASILHDHLQQVLVGAKLGNEAIQRQNLDNELKKSAAKVGKLLDESINVSRSLTIELSPPILHEGGLVPGLEWLARWFEEKQGFNVNVTAGIDIPPDSGGISVLLFQTVRELLFNTIKHAKVNEAFVSVNKKEGNILHIIVEDKGAGFNVQEIKNRGPDAGFGLFSIRERIDILGGRLNIDSAPGAGTRITITVPMPSGAKEEKSIVNKGAASLTADIAKAEIFADNHKIRVLVADDHTIVREGFTQLIRNEADMEVIAEASNGEEAVDMARRYRPDVIVMDISMPKMNGIEATELIVKEMPGIRVIGLSMYEKTVQEKAILMAGAMAYLTKYGPSKDLIAAIRGGGGSLISKAGYNRYCKCEKRKENKVPKVFSEALYSLFFLAGNKSFDFNKG